MSESGGGLDEMSKMEMKHVISNIECEVGND